MKKCTVRAVVALEMFVDRPDDAEELLQSTFAHPLAHTVNASVEEIITLDMKNDTDIDVTLRDDEVCHEQT